MDIIYFKSGMKKLINFILLLGQDKTTKGRLILIKEGIKPEAVIILGSNETSVQEFVPQGFASWE